LSACEERETVLEDATAKVRLEFVDDELRQTALELGSLAKAWPIAGDDLVQQGLLGLAALVAVAALAACTGLRRRHDRLSASGNFVCTVRVCGR
jgi:hypothetical protein